METTITIGQLAQAVLFILIVVVGIYAGLVLKQVNILARQLRTMISTNQEQLDKIVLNLSTVTENSAQVSTGLRDGFNEAARTIRSLGRETADTVLTINKTADYISTYAVIIQEVVKTLIKLFSGDKK